MSHNPEPSSHVADENSLSPMQGREIISNLSKAAGLAQMIAAMRPDIDNIDEYVRNTTARAFSVVAGALGIPALLPFLKAVCLSKKSWQVCMCVCVFARVCAAVSQGSMCLPKSRRGCMLWCVSLARVCMHYMRASVCVCVSVLIIEWFEAGMFCWCVPGKLV